MRVGDVERPVPEDDKAVRVHASTVTRDAMGVQRRYRFTRSHRYRRPANSLRQRVRRTVEEVGAAVTEFQVGDDVFGVEGGANAEYVTVDESGVIAPPTADV